MVSIVSAARDLARLREVSAVLVRHGFGEVAGRIGIRAPRGKESDPPPAVLEADARRSSLAVRVRQVLEDLGPSFVKLGQLASTRPDLLPADLIAELKKLQDSLPALPFSEIEQQVERSLGAPIAELFESFEEAPLATASIAQVHRARARVESGVVEVAVKVQRPGIATTIASDLDILHSLAALLERAIPETRIYSPVGLVQQFDHAITAELDFSTEADNARRFAQNFAGEPSVRFPAIHRQLSSRHVVTMEFMEGQKVYDAVAAGHSGAAIARLALRAMVKQIYEDGFFHADPHPGNVLISGSPEAPTLTLLDLGMVGRLSPRLRELTVDVITSALRRDYDGIAEALYAIGTPTKKVNMDAYRAEVALLAERYLERSLAELEVSAMLRDLVRAATKYGIEIPTDFVMMGKALMTVEGVGKEIAPDFDIYSEARPLFAELLRKRYSPERVGSELLRRLERLSGASYRVPQQLEEVLDDLRLGRLSVRVEDERHASAAEHVGRRLFNALLGSSALLSGAIVYGAGSERLGAVLMGLSLLPLCGYFLGELWRTVRRR
jgi:ubiquinone biosynthesis protein